MSLTTCYYYLCQQLITDYPPRSVIPPTIFERKLSGKERINSSTANHVTRSRRSAVSYSKLPQFCKTYYFWQERERETYRPRIHASTLCRVTSISPRGMTFLFPGRKINSSAFLLRDGGEFDSPARDPRKIYDKTVSCSDVRNENTRECCLRNDEPVTKGRVPCEHSSCKNFSF